MKVLFWVPYPKAESPSQRFRFEQYLSLLSQNGIQYKLSTFWDDQSWKILYLPGKTFQKLMGFVRGIFRRIASVFTLSSYDFIFIHREAMPLGPPIFEWIAYLSGKKIIYDFDDAIWLPNTSAENKIAGWLKWHRKVSSICRWSTQVSCGNEFLCSYARQYNKNVVFNPTTIDTEHLHNPTLYPVQRDSRITIGWTGTHSTLKYLDFLEPIFQSLEQKFPGQVRFLVIANKKPDLKLHSLEFIPWNKSTEIPDLLKLDIGVMPLTDDIWAKGKCGFKALQYMALGVPCVISPVGVNSEIVDNGVTGFLATTKNEWIEKLERLMADQKLREAMGKKGREKVEAEYSVKSNAANFLQLFS
ncbi:MAG TPA: glycosyltransferase family 4 protein [Cyclobacteriaceae bacterium]|nr:glycosyltransferase family 4 protein [Cyclobacteriaceae bacterium]HMV11014.1 glycosyltransferase family 4 protein [Cyclobacteriaceae bacterium]HMV88613.1 glycosyltransferase family 4 protein [Cyclobacteriaceae bacterium]HMX00625.1 glycosyltransferase family 4 protein [Cyclobacteriaceae bacterium]HMX49500.1 glycosyltransferase family 4 protein [Cyclobacteriaceae bacterium]